MGFGARPDLQGGGDSGDPRAGTARAAAPARDPVLWVRATPGPGVSAARGRASLRLRSVYLCGRRGRGCRAGPGPALSQNSRERSHPNLLAPPLSDGHVSPDLGGGGRAAQSLASRLSPRMAPRAWCAPSSQCSTPRPDSFR